MGMELSLKVALLFYSTGMFIMLQIGLTSTDISPSELGHEGDTTDGSPILHYLRCTKASKILK